MENILYEIIKPARVLENNKSWFGKNKKVMFGIIGVIVVCSCLGIYSNYDTLQNYIPSFNTADNLVYSWTNHSIPTMLINPTLINPSFSAGGFKIGYN
jgi:hypothetical protein